MGNNHSKRRIRSSNIISALAIASDTVQLAGEAAPGHPAFGILSATSGILSVIKNTVKNKEDFRDLIERCEWIGRLIENNSIIIRDQTPPALLEAMHSLEDVVKTTRDKVAKSGKRNVYQRIFTSSLDLERIKKMTSQLNRAVNNLETALHLYNTETLHSQTRSITAIQASGTRNEISRPTSTPPPRPSIFCGRVNLVDYICSNLITATESHIALLGAGGIGKSSIAKAVLNEPQIEDHFSDRRFFIRFDDILSSQITYATFIDRVSRALGIATGSDHGQILEVVREKRTLLVLDNGETFLDPEPSTSRDISRIKTAIDEIGGFSSVSIVLTSRSRELPRGLMWERIQVPSLEPAPAFDVFTKIFQRDVLQSRTTLEEILVATGYHPLTITLLAYAAETNSWSIDDLNERWTARRTKLLNAGYGRYENLADSIEISLTSPCVAAFGEDVRRIFRILAFFPQGIPRKRLEAMFPSISQVAEIVEVLHKQSLIIFIDEFASMLAPIRLHALDAIPNPDTVLLNDARSHYYGVMHASVVTDRQSILAKDGNVLILSEDVNIEALISFDLQALADDKEIQRALQACEVFIYCLHLHKPRSTPLKSVLHSLDTAASPSIYSGKFGCLKALVALSLSRYDMHECIELCTIVRDMAVAAGQNDDAIQATLFVANFHLYLGDCTAAKKIIDSAHETPGWSTMNDLSRALACGIMGHFKALTDPQITGAALVNTYYCEAHRLLKAARSESCPYFPLTIFALAPALTYASGPHRDLQIAQAQLKEMNLDYEEEFGTQSPSLLLLLANVTFADQDINEAKGHLERALGLGIGKGLLFTAQILVWLTIVAIAEGKPSEARKLFKRADEHQKDSNIFSKRNRCYGIYVSGVIELVSGHISKAMRIFKETREYCEPCGEFHIRALCARAMGEVAYLQGEFAQARRFFEETVEICTAVGIVPHLFFSRSHTISMLTRVPPATYGAWPGFLKARSNVVSQ